MCFNIYHDCDIKFIRFRVLNDRKAEVRVFSFFKNYPIANLCMNRGPNCLRLFLRKMICYRSNRYLLLVLLSAVLLNIVIPIANVHSRIINQISTSVNVYDNSKSPNFEPITGIEEARAKTKETSTPEFIRLVTMRLIYGLAATMGVEERLENIFNGAFVPPNAHEDSFGLDGLDDYADGDDDYGDTGSLFRDVVEDAF